MADVRAFRGLRYSLPQVGDLSRVLCPPYDVISAPEAQRLRAASPYNAIHLELPEALPGETGDERYRRAAATLQAWRAAGVLVRDAEPRLYAIEEAFSWPAGHPQLRRGLLAVVRLADWAERVVLPHEHTLAAPKADRLQLLRACATNISPVFLLYPPQPAAEAALWGAAATTPPQCEAQTPDGGVVRVWALSPPAGAALLAALAESRLYIADGHHRYETALRYRDERRAAAASDRPMGYDYVLSYLVSMADPGLVVLATHRWVPAERVDRQRLAALLAERFVVVARHKAPPGGLAAATALAELRRWGARHTTFGLYQAGELLLIQPCAAASRWLPAERHPAWRALDTAQVESLLLQPLLGPDAAEALAYTRDAAEALAAVDAGRAAFAVLLNPPSPAQIAAVADAGERMPQKSTYFYPKLPTGLAFHVLDDAALG